MKCFYINLDSAARRRESLERNFREVGADGWNLVRVAATTVAEVGERNVKGAAAPAEKACFISHARALQRNRDSREHFLICEDDVLFGRRTWPALAEFIKFAADTNVQWDILFTDVGVPEVADMLELLRLRRQLAPADKVTYIDLKSLRFYGATAYLVNKDSAAALHAAVARTSVIDLPFDLFLRQLVTASSLRAIVAFPFITSVSDEAATSAIQSPETAATDLIWNQYRRMIWREGGADAQSGVMARLSATVSDEAKAFGLLWAAIADSNFRMK